MCWLHILFEICSNIASTKESDSVVLLIVFISKLALFQLKKTLPVLLLPKPACLILFLPCSQCEGIVCVFPTAVPFLTLLSVLQCCEVALSLELRLHPLGVSEDAVGYLAEHHSLRMDHPDPTTGGLRGDRRALLRALLLRGQRGNLSCPL